MPDQATILPIQGEEENSLALAPSAKVMPLLKPDEKKLLDLLAKIYVTTILNSQKPEHE